MREDMKKVLFILLCLGLVGCASLGSVDKLRTENRQNILQLNIGMTKQEVLNVMGTKSATDVYASGLWGSLQLSVNNPYKSEILQGNNKTFEVLYYYTDTKKTFKPYAGEMPTIQDDELTPLVFDESKLIGWGWSFLEENIKKYEIRLR